MHTILPRYDAATLTPMQLLSAAAHGDWEIEAIPRTVTVTFPNPGTKTITWTDPRQPLRYRAPAAAAALHIGGPVTRLLHDRGWADLPPRARRHFARIARDLPTNTLQLLQEMKGAGVTLSMVVAQLAQAFQQWR